MKPNLLHVAAELERLLADLGETISLDDIKHHDDLRRIVVAADDITNRIEYRALEWAKTR